MRKTFLVACLFASLAVASAGWSSPTSSDVDRTARSIYGEFMSPYCPGLLLGDCRSDQAALLRDDIRARLAAGESEAEVRQGLEDVYGEKVRAAPAGHGFGLIAWLTPFVVLAAGAGVAMRWIGANRLATPTTGESRDELTPQRRARLDAELSRGTTSSDVI